MTSKNNTAPLLYYAKLYASFQIHQWIQTGFVVWKCSIRVKIADFLSRVTLNFGGWSWNKANLRDLIAVTGLVILLKLDSNHRFFSLCDLEIQWMTPKNKCTSSILHQALCIISNPPVNSNWSYSSETPNLGKNQHFFFSYVTLKFDVWTWKTIGRLFNATSSFVFFGSKSTNFFSRVTLQFNVWPWK